MLKPPFSRTILPRLGSTSTHPHQPVSKAASIIYSLPASYRFGDTLARTADDPDAYFMAELAAPRLDKIMAYLWLAGLPSCARPLHRQQLVGREIIITEDPNEHLIWHETRIFIKPLPNFLLDLDCWMQKICKNRQLHEAACGFLLSYAWLIRHESDLRIAHEKRLLPDFVQWTVWTEFVNDFLGHIDLQSLSGVSPRYHYGELRLSRLNKIYSTTRCTWKDLAQGYMTTPTWYKDFFARNFAWLLAVFAVVSVALSGMQVILTSTKSTETISSVSYGFAVLSLLVSAGSILGLFSLWLVLFLYHLTYAHINHRNIMKKRYLKSLGTP